MELTLFFCDYVEHHCHNGSKPRGCPGNESTSTGNEYGLLGNFHRVRKLPYRVGFSIWILAMTRMGS